MTRPRKAVPALRTAMMIREAAEHELRRSIATARAEGLSWAEIGEVLRLPGTTQHRAEAAYRRALGIAPERGHIDHPPDRTFHWPCGRCGRLITDHGPHEPHPRNNQSGHAKNCIRHHTEITAYETTLRLADQVPPRPGQ